jgi:prepilin-type N-terminal cleavage/methylation domain-containing protein
MSRGPSSQARQGGFTLLELVVVMGILSGFLVMLVQLVDAGLRLFGEGESGQALADRSSNAQRVIEDELRLLRGSATGRDRDRVDARLLVQWLPIGLPPRPERGATRVQVIRAAAHLPADRELALVEPALASRVIAEHPELPAAEIEKRVAELLPSEPLAGIGNMLLLPWRQQGSDDALLELRVGWFLPGQLLPLRRDRFVDPFEVVVPGGEQLPATLVEAITTPILKDLLHVEFWFWSQRTTSWDEGAVGPERIWDSARGGWLVDELSGGTFAFDRGPWSLADGTDDIHPHAILVRCVVAQPPGEPAEGLLADAIADDAAALTLLDGERFPGPIDGGFAKVEGEWIRYAERDGDVLRGLRRGQRGTKAIPHAAGTRVHFGRSVQFVVPVPHKKDDWNG